MVLLSGEVQTIKVKLAPEEMDEVVQNVQSRVLGSLDKEEPEIVDEFLRKMKDGISEVHATEGYPNRKVAKSRDADDDWLTKLVKQNEHMKSLIPKKEKKDNEAVADS